MGKQRAGRFGKEDKASNKWLKKKRHVGAKASVTEAGVGSQQAKHAPPNVQQNHWKKQGSTPLGGQATTAKAGYKQHLGRKVPAAGTKGSKKVKHMPPTAQQIQLNKQLVSCRSGVEILYIVRSRLADFNLVNCTTALQRLVKASGPTSVRCSPDLASLMQRTIALVQQAGISCPPQNLANALWACCRLPADIDASGLVESAREILKNQDSLKQFQGQHVANIVWAVAKLGGPAAADFVPFAEAIRTHAYYLNGQELSMSAWALATCGVSVGLDKIVDAVRALRGGVKSLEAQQVATLAWALAKLGYENKPLFREIAEVIQEDVAAGRFNSHDLSSLAWAFGRLQVKAQRLFDCIGAVVRKRLVHDARAAFTPRHLSMILWAFAKVDIHCAATTNVIVEAACDLVSELGARDLTDIVWAIATLGASAQKFLKAAGEAAVKRHHEFNSQEMLKFVGAFRKAGGDATLQQKLAAEQRELTFDFPALGAQIVLAAEMPGSLPGKGTAGGDPQRADGRATGTALWDASFVLGEWLSRQAAGLDEAVGNGWHLGWKDWKGKTGIELGAGLGLPSIVAAQLGVQMVATDGDQAVLTLLEKNGKRNVPRLRGRHKGGGSICAKKLLWSSDVSYKDMGLTQQPDLLLAADVIYASAREELTNQLVATIRQLCGPATLVLVANVRRFPVRHPKGEGRFFVHLDEFFDRVQLPQHCLHRDFQKTGVGSCVVHILKLRASQISGAPHHRKLRRRSVKLVQSDEELPKLKQRKRKRKKREASDEDPSRLILKRKKTNSHICDQQASEQFVPRRVKRRRKK